MRGGGGEEAHVEEEEDALQQACELATLACAVRGPEGREVGVGVLFGVRIYDYRMPIWSASISTALDWREAGCRVI